MPLQRQKRNSTEILLNLPLLNRLLMNLSALRPLCAALLLLVIFVAASCGNRTAVVTFRECDDSTADTLADWSGVKKGLHAAWGQTDARYARSVVPILETGDTCRLTAWRGERVSAQAVLWTADSVGGVECRVGDFRSADGTVLPSAMARAHFVRYVVSDTFGPGCGHRKNGDFPISLKPDMLDTLDRFDMDRRMVRPVWVSIDVPEDAPAGLYRSYVEVRGKQRLPLELRVYDRQLPPPSQWSYHLDLWQHPAAVARVDGLEVWSDAHFEAMRPVMQMLADAGQKVVTATLNKDPWRHQCYDGYEDMIRWTRNADGSWTYDYTVFDRWVEFMISLGVDRQINCYSMLPWNNELHYRDAAADSMVTVSTKPGTPKFKKIWTPFLRDFTAHLEKKGWLGKCCIAMDERSPETMAEAIGLLRREAPELGIALADNHASYKRYPDLEDVCVQIDCRVADSDLAQRQRDGLVTTYYVCCSSEFPNVFTLSEPWEATYMAWFAAACGYDGMLRWAYNSWPEDPVRDARYTAWPSGDTFIVYPGARSSIRFEKLREGIQDYEKIRLLRHWLMAEGTSEAQAKLAELNAVVTGFETSDPTQPWPELLRKAKGTLDRLSE